MDDENKTKVSIIEEYPSIKTDVSVLNLIMDPLEIYVLKVFLWKLPPKTVRKIYDYTIKLIFIDDFLYDDIEKNKFFQTAQKYNLLGLLDSGGYEPVRVNPEYTKKYEKILYEQRQLSSTELSKFMESVLKKHNIKYPSYEKIKGICEKFENNEILEKKIQGRKILFNLNPSFFMQISKKKKEILEL